ncbi:MAG: Polyphosphate:AMP phosphotransferase, partial [bacterium]
MLETIQDQTITSETYNVIFPQLEARLSELQREARSAGIPVVVVFEGWDSAGKGTHINKLMQPMDPRGFKVWSINLPTQEELYHPFLWRFWTKLPARGAIAIFDHSWYGRVL